MVSYKPSKYVKKWDSATKIVKICEKSAKSQRTQAISNAANAESNVKHQQEWLKKAVPALRDLKNIPDEIKSLQTQLSENFTSYAMVIVNLIAVEGDIAEESDEKKKKKLISQHKQFEKSAGGFAGIHKQLANALTELEVRHTDLTEILFN